MSLELLKGMGVKIDYKNKYDNFIGGKWVAPVKGEYFDVITPITGTPATLTSLAVEIMLPFPPKTTA